jgi:CubicO group peptidase (beta-lactamase class C family)
MLAVTRRRGQQVAVDAIFSRWDRPDSPGCSVGVVRDGQLVYQRGYGMASLDHAIPLNGKTVFYIASTSKQFTAMSIASLVTQGRLALTDDIRRFVPELPRWAGAGDGRTTWSTTRAAFPTSFS